LKEKQQKINEIHESDHLSLAKEKCRK